MARWGGGFKFIEHHDLYFFVVDAHTTSLCPVLAGVDHRLELRWGSGYEYHAVDIEEGSNPVEVVNGGDLREFKEWEFGSQFEDKFHDIDGKEGRADSFVRSHTFYFEGTELYVGPDPYREFFIFWSDRIQENGNIRKK